MKLRTTTAIVALILLTACAASGPINTPLPADLRVTPPLAVVPERIAAFSGKWVGRWDGQLDSTLVVERVEGGTAHIVYSWGTSRNVSRPGFVRAVGTINDAGVLTATLPNGATVDFRLASDQKSLSAQYSLRGIYSTATFRRPQA